MNIIKLVSLLTTILKDEALWAAVQKLIEFISSLSKEQQAAYLSKFTAPGGYGCPCGPDCPDCPDDCKPAEDALLAACEG